MAEPEQSGLRGYRFPLPEAKKDRGRRKAGLPLSPSHTPVYGQQDVKDAGRSCENIPGFCFHICLFTACVLSEVVIGSDGVKDLYVSQETN